MVHGYRNIQKDRNVVVYCFSGMLFSSIFWGASTDVSIVGWVCTPFGLHQGGLPEKGTIFSVAIGTQAGGRLSNQWRFLESKMWVLYYIRPNFVGIFSYAW